MKLLITSDWHVDWVTAGHERHDDVEAAVIQTVEKAIQEKVDAYVMCGDLSDPNTSRSYRAISVAIRAAETLNEAGIRNIWVNGNHDVIEDGYGTSVLSPLIELDSGGLTDVVTMPRLTRIEGPGEEHIDAFILPYTPRSHTYDPTEEVLKRVGPDTDGPQLVVGHLCIEGIHPGSETTHMPRGRDVYFPYDAISTHWPDALLVNGHYHQHQTWKGTSGRNKQPIHIPGSLARLTFGEADITPGYLLMEVTSG